MPLCTLVETTLSFLQGKHQREGVVWMCQREARPGAVPCVAGGILADEMGMGKTYEVAALMRLRPMQTLIVTTLSTLMQWQDVLSTHLGELPFVLRSKDQAEGVAFARVRTVLTTYSMFQRSDRVPSALHQGWGRIVLDEAHVIRNPKANMHRALSKLRAVHRWVLTGTPVSNTIRDLDSLVVWLGAPGLDISLVCQHLMLMRTKALILDYILPSLTVTDSIIVLGPAERLAYNMIEAAGREHAEIDNSRSLQTFVHVHAMEAVLRCRQACTHLSIMSEAIHKANRVMRTGACTRLQLALRDPAISNGKTVGLLMSAKIARLVQLISSHSQTEKSLVFCDWLKEMDVIETALVERVGVRVLRYHGAMDVMGRQGTLRSFQSMEEGAVLLIQIQCGGTGLSIQSASRVYMMRPAWNPCIERQAIARVHRLGQTRPVVVTRLVTADSIDVRCDEVQRRKLEVIQSVVGRQPLLTQAIDNDTLLSLLS